MSSNRNSLIASLFAILRLESMSHGFCHVVVAALCFSAVGLLGVRPAEAQDIAKENDSGWQFAGAVYLWGAGIDGRTQSGADVTVSFGDLVDNLEMGFMGALAARKGKWSVFTDVIYLDVGADKSIDVSVPVGPGFIDVTTAANLDLKGLVLQFAGGYNLLMKGESRLDLVAGTRYLDLDMDLFLSLEALGPGLSRTLAESGSVWDGIVGVKGNIALGDRWYLPYYFDIGTGESEFTWQALGGVSFRAANWVDLALVYRQIDWDFGSDSLIDDLSFSGPALGAIFRF